MPRLPDMKLVEEIHGGDPLMTPDEAAGALGITERELQAAAGAGLIPSIQLIRRGPRRYRTSVIERLARTGL